METYDKVSRKVLSSHYHNNEDLQLRTHNTERKQRNFATKILTYSIRITLLFSSSYASMAPILLDDVYEDDKYPLFTIAQNNRMVRNYFSLPIKPKTLYRTNEF